MWGQDLGRPAGKTAATGVPDTAPTAQQTETNGHIPVRDRAVKNSKHIDDDQKDELTPGEDPDNRLVSPFVKHLAGDQKEFWTAPADLQKKDLEWIVPFAGVTAGFIASDSWISKQIPLGEVQRSQNISNYGVYSLNWRWRRLIPAGPYQR